MKPTTTPSVSATFRKGCIDLETEDGNPFAFRGLSGSVVADGREFRLDGGTQTAACAAGAIEYRLPGGLLWRRRIRELGGCLYLDAMLAPERLRLVKMCLPRTEGIPVPVDLFDNVAPDGHCHILKKAIVTDWDVSRQGWLPYATESEWLAYVEEHRDPRSTRIIEVKNTHGGSA